MEAQLNQLLIVKGIQFCTKRSLRGLSEELVESEDEV